jgi:copper homeostasis protein
MVVEIVCCRVADVVAARQAGAHRVELCSAIELGGLSPSFGLTVDALEVGLPILAMIRPRGAGFLYDNSDFQVMKADVLALSALPIAGFVTGILVADGRLDVARMAELRYLAPDMDWVCHRAFDAVPDPFAALDQLVELGFTRVLTSGQRPRATDAVSLVRDLVAYAGDRIEVLPAGGLRPHNVASFVEATGVTQVHLAPFEWVTDTSTVRAREAGIGYGIPEVPREDAFREIDGDAVRAVVTAFS